MEQETGILRAEAARRTGRSAYQDLLAWRYGAITYALGLFDELGLDRLARDDLHAWTARFATRGNAVLALTGAPPAGLRLHLPDGEHHAPPDPRESVIPVRRTTIPGSDDAVALHAVIDRSYAAGAAAFLLRSRLVDTLRTRLALSYSPSVGYERLTGDDAALGVVTDVLDGRVPEASRAFVRVLFETLEAAETGADETYLEEYRGHLRAERSGPQALLGYLGVAGWDLLHGKEITQPDQGFEQALAVDGAAVATTLRQALDSALLRLPPQANRPTGWEAAPVCIQPRVTGKWMRRWDPRIPHYLILGDSGITYVRLDDSFTIRFDDVAVMLSGRNQRALVGRDGTRIDVHSEIWRGGAAIIERIDARVPPSLNLPREDWMSAPELLLRTKIWYELLRRVGRVRMVLLVVMWLSGTTAVDDDSVVAGAIFGLAFIGLFVPRRLHKTVEARLRGMWARVGRTLGPRFHGAG